MQSSCAIRLQEEMLCPGGVFEACTKLEPIPRSNIQFEHAMSFKSPNVSPRSTPLSWVNKPPTSNAFRISQIWINIPQSHRFQRQISSLKKTRHRFCGRGAGYFFLFRDLQHLENRLEQGSSGLWTNCFSFNLGSIPGWWFGTFFIFPYIGNNDPN